MTAFGETQIIIQGIILTVFTLIMLMPMICLILSFSAKVRPFMFFLSFALFAFGFMFLIFSAYSEEAYLRGKTTWLYQMPLVLILTVIFVYACMSALNLFYLIRWKNSHITLHSIRESTDLLPTALCCYISGGMPVLVNRKMTEISIDITGHEVLNAEHLSDILKSHGNDNGIVVMPDGEYYSFTQKPLSVDGKEMFELVGTNVTSQYILSKKLEDENRRLMQMNERLRRYNQNVEEVTRQKEILAAKIHIHDNIGHLLLSAKRVLSKPFEQSDAQELLKLWQQDMTLLINKPPEFCTDSVFIDLDAAAASLGIEIRYRGALPHGENMISELSALAVRECLTNAFSHAQATGLDVDFGENDTCFIVKCRNNGKPPDGTICEGGGLSSLRKRIEEYGGSMEIKSQPYFELIVDLPKGGFSYE